MAEAAKRDSLIRAPSVDNGRPGQRTSGMPRPPPSLRSADQCSQRSSAAIWIRLPQVSFTMAMVEPVTLVGGIVKSAPSAFMRSYSGCTSST